MRGDYFDPTVGDTLGVVGGVRDAEDATFAGAHVVGGSMGAATNEARGHYRQGMSTCSGISCLFSHAGAFGTELFAGIAPQNGNQVMFDAAITVGSLGLGGTLSGVGELVESEPEGEPGRPRVRAGGGTGTGRPRTPGGTGTGRPRTPLVMRL